VRVEAAARKNAGSWRLRDVETGSEVPHGIVEEEGEIVLDSPPVPALGYRLIEVERREGTAPAAKSEAAPAVAPGLLENQALRIELDPASGSVRSVVSKGSGRRWAPSGGRGIPGIFVRARSPFFERAGRDSGTPLGEGAPRAAVSSCAARASVRFDFPRGALRSIEYSVGASGPEMEARVVIDGDAWPASAEGRRQGEVIADIELALDPRDARFRVEGPGPWFEPERDRFNGAPPSTWAACAARWRST